MRRDVEEYQWRRRPPGLILTLRCESVPPPPSTRVRRLGLRSYVSGDVGIVHEPGTTHRNHERTKVEPDEQMRRNARNSMLDVLEQRYGRDWGEVFARASREAGVDPHAFLEWSKYDRGLSLAGVRA